MSSTATYAIEIAVGAGCLVGVPGAWRHPRLRWVAALLLVAGLAAVIHGAAAILS